MFVLVTSRPDMLLPTVRSRCQRLRFGRLAPADVAAVLMREHAYAEADAHAAASCRTAASGARSREAPEAFVDAREAAADCSRPWPRRTIRAAGSRARRR